MFYKIKNALATSQQESSGLLTLISDQSEKNIQLQEEHKQAVLHIETLNMMTKYQLVYLKLETQLKKILQSLDTRHRMRLKRGFQAFKTSHFENAICQKV